MMQESPALGIAGCNGSGVCVVCDLPLIQSSGVYPCFMNI